MQAEVWARGRKKKNKKSVSVPLLPRKPLSLAPPSLASPAGKQWPTEIAARNSKWEYYSPLPSTADVVCVPLNCCVRPARLPLAVPLCRTCTPGFCVSGFVYIHIPTTLALAYPRLSSIAQLRFLLGANMSCFFFSFLLLRSSLLFQWIIRS